MKLGLATMVSTASKPNFRRGALIAWRVAVLLLLALLLHQVHEVSDSIERDPATASQLSDVAFDLRKLRGEVDSVKAEIDSVSLQILMMRR
jgi:hypothetical protein